MPTTATAPSEWLLSIMVSTVPISMPNKASINIGHVIEMMLFWRGSNFLLIQDHILPVHILPCFYRQIAAIMFGNTFAYLTNKGWENAPKPPSK
jgi:hypothetical protein